VIETTSRHDSLIVDKQEAATRTVLEQAELLCAEWAV
jgi:hypothetical protein